MKEPTRQVGFLRSALHSRNFLGVMMQEMHFDFLTAFLAVISAYLWARSSRVEFNFGFDMGQHNNDAMKTASKLNARAAAFAAVAAVVQAAKPAYGAFIGFV